MGTATAVGLLAPLALFAALALNAILLWRAAPSVLRALAGPLPMLVPGRIVPDGESNVVPLQRGPAGGVRTLTSARPVRQLQPLAA